MRSYSMGALYAVPNAVNPTPIPIASLKGCKIGIKQGKASFRGNQVDIVDVANKGRDWSITIDHADFRASALQMVAPNGVITTGSVQPAIAEAITIAATNTVANAATFVEDAGVLDYTSGKWMTRVASAPIAGQYSVVVATGVYTFAAADAGHLAAITYSYSSVTLGLTTTISNAIQSQSVPYKLRMYNPYVVNGAQRNVGLDVLSFHSEELDLDFKVEDFAAKNLKGFASQDMIGGTLKTVVAYDSELG